MHIESFKMIYAEPGMCIDNDGLTRFDRDVTAALKDGWELHGPPFCWDTAICQAVIFRERKHDRPQR